MSRSQRLAWIWVLAIFVLHVIPRSGIEAMPGGQVFVQSRWQDKMAHTCMFAILGSLFLIDPTRARGRVLAGGLGYGAILEVLQELAVPGRSGSGTDFACDAAGLATALILVSFWRRGAGYPSVES